MEPSPEAAPAIKTLGGFIENSGNREAAENFKELHAELAAPKPNRTIMRALWAGIVAALPQIKTLTDVVTAITAMLA